jgi:hypothetical protein
MGISNFLGAIFPKKEDTRPHIKVRKDSLFLDDKNHETLLKNGWCKVENVVKTSELESLKRTLEQISSMEGYDMDDTMLNSGRLMNPEIRSLVKKVINENSPLIFPRIFNMNIVTAQTGGAYQIKPPSLNSSLAAHQDSAVVNEDVDYCLFMWIPLCDVGENNGHLLFLPGSHLWGNKHRSMCVPWNFEKHSKLLERNMVQVNAKAGDVIIFDPAVIHASTPNLSQETRSAITMTVLRKSHQLVYYYKDPKASNMVYRYEVDESFFVGCDFNEAPDDKVWKKYEEPYNSFDLSEKEILKLIKTYR